MDNGVGFGSEAPRRQARTRLWPVLPLAATGWWVVGALPWIVDGVGSRSPRTWASDVATGSATDGYISLLPFTTARLGLLVTLTLVGGAVATFATLWLRPREGRRLASAALAVVGALTAAAYAMPQSAGATRQLGNDFDRDDRVLLGVLAVAVVGTLLGLALGLVVVLAGPVPRALAGAALAVALGGWVSALLAALGAAPSGGLLPWGPVAVGVVVGMALVGLELRPARLVTVWVFALAVVLVGTAAQTAFGYLAALLRPRSGLPTGFRDHLEATRDVFLLALRPEHQMWWTYAVAAAVGVIGSTVARRRAARTVRPAEPAAGATKADAVEREVAAP